MKEIHVVRQWQDDKARAVFESEKEACAFCDEMEINRTGIEFCIDSVPFNPDPEIWEQFKN